MSKFQPSSSNGLEAMMFWISGGKGWLAHWINHKAVCRTDPATPGLLKRKLWLSFIYNQTAPVKNFNKKKLYKKILSVGFTEMVNKNFSLSSMLDSNGFIANTFVLNPRCISRRTGKNSFTSLCFFCCKCRVRIMDKLNMQSLKC